MTARWPTLSHQVASGRHRAGLGQFLANSGRLSDDFCDWPDRIFVRQLRHLGWAAGVQGDNSRIFHRGAGPEHGRLKVERAFRQGLTPESGTEATPPATLANSWPTPQGATDGNSESS